MRSRLYETDRVRVWKAPCESATASIASTELARCLGERTVEALVSQDGVCVGHPDLRVVDPILGRQLAVALASREAAPAAIRGRYLAQLELGADIPDIAHPAFDVWQGSMPPGGVSRNLWASADPVATNCHCDDRHNHLHVVLGRKVLTAVHPLCPMPGRGGICDHGAANHCVGHGGRGVGPAEMLRVARDWALADCREPVARLLGADGSSSLVRLDADVASLCAAEPAAPAGAAQTDAGEAVVAAVAVVPAGWVVSVPAGFWHAVASDAGTLAVSNWLHAPEPRPSEPGEAPSCLRSCLGTLLSERAAAAARGLARDCRGAVVAWLAASDGDDGADAPGRGWLAQVLAAALALPPGGVQGRAAKRPVDDVDLVAVALPAAAGRRAAEEEHPDGAEAPARRPKRARAAAAQAAASAGGRSPDGTTAPGGRDAPGRIDRPALRAGPLLGAALLAQPSGSEFFGVADALLRGSRTRSALAGWMHRMSKPDAATGAGSALALRVLSSMFEGEVASQALALAARERVAGTLGVACLDQRVVGSAVIGSCRAALVESGEPNADDRFAAAMASSAKAASQADLAKLWVEVSRGTA